MRSIVLLTVATVIFRCDILIFLGPFTLQLLLSREVWMRHGTCRDYSIPYHILYSPVSFFLTVGCFFLIVLCRYHCLKPF
jgi:prepilin signal peptidase PulO-like enzyme (type II secretory pathway)